MPISRWRAHRVSTLPTYLPCDYDCCSILPCLAYWLIHVLACISFNHNQPYVPTRDALLFHKTKTQNNTSLWAASQSPLTT